MNKKYYPFGTSPIKDAYWVFAEDLDMIKLSQHELDMIIRDQLNGYKGPDIPVKKQICEICGYPKKNCGKLSVSCNC